MTKNLQDGKRNMSTTKLRTDPQIRLASFPSPCPSPPSRAPPGENGALYDGAGAGTVDYGSKLDRDMEAVAEKAKAGGKLSNKEKKLLK